MNLGTGDGVYTVIYPDRLNVAKLPAVPFVAFVFLAVNVTSYVPPEVSEYVCDTDVVVTVDVLPSPKFHSY